jgi:hypothetical protein
MSSSATDPLTGSLPRPAVEYARNTRSPSRRMQVIQPISPPAGAATSRTEYQGWAACQVAQVDHGRAAGQRGGGVVPARSSWCPPCCLGPASIVRRPTLTVAKRQ